MRRPPRRWGLHCCALDAACRRYTDGLLWRLHVQTPFGHLGIALTPGARFVVAGPRRGTYRLRVLSYGRPS